MSTPLLFLDLETTGLAASRAAPIALGAVILGGPHDGITFHSQMRPFGGAEIQQRALEINGYTFHEIMQWADPEREFERFLAFLCDHFPSSEPIKLAGYNFHFDNGFLREWFLRRTEQDAYGNLFDLSPVEVMTHIKQTWAEKVGTIWPKSGGMKLAFQYEYHFGRPLDKAHTEMADVIATRDLFLHCDRQLALPKYKDFHHHIIKENELSN